MRTLGLAIVLLLSATSAYAGPCDGSTPMKCEITTVMNCEPGVCVRGTAATVLLPPVLVVDVPGRLVSGDAAGRRVKIVSVSHGSGRLMLHGEEPHLGGTGWNVVVDEASGAMVGAVLTRTGGFIMFGACSAE